MESKRVGTESEVQEGTGTGPSTVGGWGGRNFGHLSILYKKLTKFLFGD